MANLKYIDSEMAEWLETRLRRRFPTLGIWVAIGWTSKYVDVTIRSYRPASMGSFVVHGVDGWGEISMRKVYRQSIREISTWRKSL